MPIGRIERPQTLDPSLSAEAEQIVQEASGEMMKWLDGAVEKLSKQTAEQLDIAAKALEEQASALEKEYDEINDQLTKLIQDINGLKTGLESTAAKQIVADAQMKVEAVRDVMKKREEQWKGAGRNAVRVTVAAAKKAILG